MDLGRQGATILKSYLKTDEKEQMYVNLKLKLKVSGDEAWTRIYVTEKSAKLAAKRLKKCGFEMKDEADLVDIQHNPDLLAGNEVDVLVEEKGNYVNVSIPIEDKPISKQKIAEAFSMLKKAYQEDAEGGPVGGDIPF